MDCIFCNILAEMEPAVFVYHDELCAAFMDIRPVNPGHVLVVPRMHAALLTELDQRSAAQMFVVAQKIDLALRSVAENGIRCEGVNLFLADGRAAGQDVMHVHLHVFPRFAGDGHHLRFSPSYYKPTPSGELERIGKLLRFRLRSDA
jgi:histidine triad (HIT) family protein